MLFDSNLDSETEVVEIQDNEGIQPGQNPQATPGVVNPQPVELKEEQQPEVPAQAQVEVEVHHGKIGIQNLT